MKFIVEQKNFLKALQKVSILLLKNHNIAILENVLINVNGNIMTVTSTNLETQITVYTTIISQDINKSTIVSGRKLLSICKSIPNNSVIKVYVNEKKMLIKSNNSVFELLIVSETSFPLLKSFNHEMTFVVSQSIIKNMIHNTQFAMAINDVRYYLNGILFEINENQLKMVATDGHRLAVSSVHLDNRYNFYSVIISRKGVLELIKLLNNRDIKLILFLNKNNIRIKIHNTVFISKLIEGNYPEYNNVLLQYPKIKIKIPTLQLKNALLRVSILSDKKFQSVKFCFCKDQLELRSNNEEEEKAKEIININIIKEEIAFNMNVNYIIDILNNMTEEYVFFSFNIPVCSVHIQEDQQSNNIFVVMPLLL
ncbi:Beta sliding clamp [Buchnera aphidicola (Thelaxes suberi)]